MASVQVRRAGVWESELLTELVCDSDAYRGRYASALIGYEVTAEYIERHHDCGGATYDLTSGHQAIEFIVGPVDTQSALPQRVSGRPPPPTDPAGETLVLGREAMTVPSSSSTRPSDPRSAARQSPVPGQYSFLMTK